MVYLSIILCYTLFMQTYVLVCTKYNSIKILNSNKWVHKESYILLNPLIISKNKGGDLLRRRNQKNLPKAHDHSFLQVRQPVKDGFDEALKDSSKKFLCFCFEKCVFFIIKLFINLFK